MMVWVETANSDEQCHPAQGQLLEYGREFAWQRVAAVSLRVFGFALALVLVAITA